MRELLSFELGAALRRIMASGRCEGVPKGDLQMLLTLELLDRKPDGVIHVTQLGRDLLRAEDVGT